MKLEAMTYCTRISAGRTAMDLTDEHLDEQLKNFLSVAQELVADEEVFSSPQPVLRMWRGYEHALCVMGMLHALEYGQKRGYNDKVFWHLRALLEKTGGSYVPVPWMRDKDVMRSHRSVLARMYPADYGDAWPGTPQRMPYLWPFIDSTADDGYKLVIAKSEQELLRAGKLRLPKDIAKRVVNLQ